MQEREQNRLNIKNVERDVGRRFDSTSWFSLKYIQRSPSVCVRSEIPGVTQVDEKGHEGNTAVVVTAYLCFLGNMEYVSRGINSD